MIGIKEILLLERREDRFYIRTIDNEWELTIADMRAANDRKVNKLSLLEVLYVTLTKKLIEKYELDVNEVMTSACSFSGELQVNIDYIEQFKTGDLERVSPKLFTHTSPNILLGNICKLFRFTQASNHFSLGSPYQFIHTELEANQLQYALLYNFEHCIPDVIGEFRDGVSCKVEPFIPLNSMGLFSKQDTEFQIECKKSVYLKTTGLFEAMEDTDEATRAIIKKLDGMNDIDVLFGSIATPELTEVEKAVSEHLHIEYNHTYTDIGYSFSNDFLKNILFAIRKMKTDKQYQKAIVCTIDTYGNYHMYRLVKCK